jgi:hypothetical protein
MRTPSSRSLRNVAAGGLALALLVGTFLTPAGAHYAGETNAHVFTEHIKPLADARYDRIRSGGQVRTRVFTNEAGVSLDGTTPQTIGGFALTVPADQVWDVLMELSAETVCTNGASQDWCVVDVRVDGSAGLADPDAQGEFAFDSTDNGAASFAGWESGTIRRWVSDLGPGAHTLDFVGYTTDATADFFLDDILASYTAYRS